MTHGWSAGANVERTVERTWSFIIMRRLLLSFLSYCDVSEGPWKFDKGCPACVQCIACRVYNTVFVHIHMYAQTYARGHVHMVQGCVWCVHSASTRCVRCGMLLSADDQQAHCLVVLRTMLELP